MTVQIAVRLPDELVAFVDRLVSDGQASSRAVVVARALTRERRQRDVAILARTGADPDLDYLAKYVAPSPLNLD